MMAFTRYGKFYQNYSIKIINITIPNEEGMKEFVSGNNSIAKPTYDECIESIQVWELNPMEV